MRITKEQNKIYMGVFVNECKEYIYKLLNLDDDINKEEYKFIDNYNNHWTIRKSLIGYELPKLIEIRIHCYNHEPYVYDKKLKGTYTHQDFYVYKKDANKNFKTGSDYAIGRADSVIIDNLSFQNYKFTLF